MFGERERNGTAQEYLSRAINQQGSCCEKQKETRDSRAARD